MQFVYFFEIFRNVVAILVTSEKCSIVGLTTGHPGQGFQPETMATETLKRYLELYTIRYFLTRGSSHIKESYLLNNPILIIYGWWCRRGSL